MRADPRPKRGWDHGGGQRAKATGPRIFCPSQVGPALEERGLLFPGEIANHPRTAALLEETLRNNLFSRAGFAIFARKQANLRTVFSPWRAGLVFPKTRPSNRSFR